MSSNSLPKVAIVGRPNVGKSTLFNRLVKRRQAIVHDVPGVTRDRQYGILKQKDLSLTLIDTGGFVPDAEEAWLERAILEQVKLALEEAKAVLLVVDGRAGLHPMDKAIAKYLRTTGKEVLVVVTKIDTEAQEVLVPEFGALGFENYLGLSAESQYGMSLLVKALKPWMGENTQTELQSSDLKIAILGQPNVGKSTLFNLLTGEERAVVHDQAGTTVDPLQGKFLWKDRVLSLTDTAGIRRRSVTEGKVEKVGVLKALDAIRQSHLVLLLIEAPRGPQRQDLRLISEVWKKNRALILVLNKWDQMPEEASLELYTKRLKETYKRFEDFSVVALSAKEGKGLNSLKKKIEKVSQNYTRRIGTGELNRVFQEATRAHPHPLVAGNKVSLNFITQTYVAPPRFTIFANKPEAIEETYLRYLERKLREAFDFQGVPLVWELKKKS
ncbi:MAG: ribosome biogenesis GTPase Der [Deltaproteobacteria bacterium]|nr:ribosome biogenesis GTPase Der [Deltaproteobacteria bacterium]